MKVLFVVDSLKSSDIGRYVSELSNNFEETGDVVSICTFGPFNEPYHLNDEIEHVDGCICSASGKPGILQKALFLRHIINEQMFTCVISFQSGNNISSVIGGIRTGACIIPCESGNEGFALLKKLLYMKLADGIACRSESACKEFSSYREKILSLEKDNCNDAALWKKFIRERMK